MDFGFFFFRAVTGMGQADSKDGVFQAGSLI
jgi:hypothetical protein